MPLAPSAVQATVTISGGNADASTIPRKTTSSRSTSSASGVYEVLVNDEVLGVYSGVTGQIDATTSNGQDNFIVDEEVTANGVVTDPAMSNPNDDDVVFAELATSASWTIEM